VRDKAAALEEKATHRLLFLSLSMPLCLCVKPLRGQITHTRRRPILYILRPNNKQYISLATATPYIHCCAESGEVQKCRIFFIWKLYIYAVCLLKWNFPARHRNIEREIVNLFCILNFLGAKIKFRILPKVLQWGQLLGSTCFSLNRFFFSRFFDKLFTASSEMEFKPVWLRSRNNKSSANNCNEENF
jgi:hypothetical protein